MNPPVFAVLLVVTKAMCSSREGGMIQNANDTDYH